MVTIFNIRPKGFNVGNDAIYMGMQFYLYQAFGEIPNIITLPATSYYETHNKAGLTAQTIYEINQYGHGVIVGGGNLYENGKFQVDVDALKSLEVPLMLFSLSHGRIYNRLDRLVERTDALPTKIISALNEKADYSLVRDEATCEYLRRIGCENIRVSGCPSVFLDRTDYRLPELPERDKGGVLISVRNPQLMSIPLHKQRRVSSDIMGIVKFLRSRRHADIRLLCHDHRDIAFAATIPGIDYVYTGDVYSYLSMLRKCSLNVSYRLHSALPCLAYDTPFIKISYDERANSLLKTIGYDDWNIKMFETENILEQVEDRYRRLGELTDFKQRAKSKLKALDHIIAETFEKFARDVCAYKATTDEIERIDEQTYSRHC